MYNVVEYNKIYQKPLEHSWYHNVILCRNITSFFSSDSLKFKQKITGRSPANSYAKDVETFEPIKYFSNV